MKRQQMRALAMALMLTTALPAAAAHAQAAPTTAPKPWMNTRLSADQRADLIVAQMTQEDAKKELFASVEKEARGGGIVCAGAKKTAAATHQFTGARGPKDWTRTTAGTASTAPRASRKAIR